ncbi:MAG: glycosyl transferase, partial [Spirochaetota bacterium]
MEVRKAILVSPPFSSQLNSTIALAHAFLEKGVDTFVACSQHFRDEIVHKRINFVPLVVSLNINTGIAQRTRQDKEEAEKIYDFLEATKVGAIETLMIQTRDRKHDMLFDPSRLRSEVLKIDKQLRPDLWVANQLSYSLTLVLYSLRLPFVTLCLPHPFTIPNGEKIYGVPARWPIAFKVNQDKLSMLKDAAQKVEKEFTHEFNSKIEHYDKKLEPVSRAFSLTSPNLILYNYPNLWDIKAKSASPKKI